MSGEPRSGKAVALVLLPAAVAVAAIMLVLRMRMEPPTVPGYALTGASTPALARGGTFTMDLTPGAELAGAIAARGFLLRGDEVRPWAPPFAIDRDGSVHVRGEVDRLFAGVPDGPWEAAVVVGRPETLPTAPGDVLRARDAGAGPAAWRLLRTPIVLGP